MYRLKLKHHFDACHNLLDYDGKCANLHGHRWNVEVKIETPKLVKDMVADFGLIKSIIDRFDHGYLNEIIDFNPTAENIAMYLKREIANQVNKFNDNIVLCEVTVWESPEASITI